MIKAIIFMLFTTLLVYANSASVLSSMSKTQAQLLLTYEAQIKELNKTALIQSQNFVEEKNNIFLTLRKNKLLLNNALIKSNEDNISYYTNCLDSHFYINDIEIKEYEHIEKALKDSFKVEIEVLDYKILDDLENGADYDKTMGGDYCFYEKIADKMQEEFFEVHNIRAEYQPSLDFPDEYDNDALYFIFYPEKKMSEDEVELLEEYINKEIKPMFIENINKAKQESKEISQRRLKKMTFYDIDEYDFITNMSPKELDRFEDFLYKEDDREEYLKFLYNFKQLPYGENSLSYFKEKEITEIQKEYLIFYLSTIKDFYSGGLKDVTTYLHHLEECGLDVDAIFDENFSMLYEWLENEAFELGHDTIYDFLYETAKIDLDKDFFIKSALQPNSVDKDDRKYLQNFIVSAYLYSNSHIISELDSEEFFEYSNNKNLQEQTDLFLENLRQDNLSEKDFYCKEAIENALKLGIESAPFRKEEACDGLLKIVYLFHWNFPHTPALTYP